ncbi:MAG: hypothetical protein AMXMBFR84_18350 [Candidatus Hydrogenedentota bacterium]
MSEEKQLERVKGDETAAEAPVADATVADGQAPLTDRETNEAALEERLAEPVFTGMEGIDKAQVWIAAFLLVIAGAIAFSNIFGAEFYLPDRQQVLEQPAARHFTTLPEALGRVPGGPIAVWTYAMHWITGGDAPRFLRAFHLTLHLLNGVLVFLLCRRLMPKGTPEPVSLTAGLLFVLHPANTETVITALGRPYLLGLFFVMSSLILALRAIEHRRNLFSVEGSAAVLCFVLAWGCSPLAWIVPPMALVFDAQVNRGIRRQSWTVHASLWAVAILCVATAYAYRQTLPQEIPFDAGKDAYPLEAYAQAVTQGVMTSISPTSLSPVYAIPDSDELTANPRADITLALSLIVPMILAGLFLSARRIAPGVALVWFGLAFVAVAVGFSPENPYSDRWVYGPIAGLAMIVPWVLVQLKRQPKAQRIAGGAIAVLLLAAAVGVFLRNQTWRSEVALWMDAASKSPDAALPYQALGAIHTARAEEVLMHQAGAAAGTAAGAAQQREAADRFMRLAEERLRQAVQRDGEHVPSLLNSGLVHEFYRRYSEASEVYIRALHIDPANPQIAARLGRAYQGLHAETGNRADLQRAVEHYGRADRLNGLDSTGRIAYSFCLLAIRDIENAARQLDLAAGNDPESPAANQLKFVRQSLIQIRQDEMKAMEALRQNPSDRAGLLGEASVLFGRGRALQALYVLSGLMKGPQSELDAWVLMGLIKGYMDDESSFLSAYQPPVAQEGAPSPWTVLATACVQSDLWGSAEEYLNASALRPGGVQKPLLVLAQLALQLQQPQRALQLLDTASNTYADDPQPWLMLCDMAIAGGNAQTAARYLAEAEKRNAKPEDIASRRDKVGTQATPEQPTFDTIIR